MTPAAFASDANVLSVGQSTGLILWQSAAAVALAGDAASAVDGFHYLLLQFSTGPGFPRVRQRQHPHHPTPRLKLPRHGLLQSPIGTTLPRPLHVELSTTSPHLFASP